MVKLKWMELASKLIGLQEIKGAQHAPKIAQMWKGTNRFIEVKHGFFS